MKQFLLFIFLVGFIATGKTQPAGDQILGQWQNEQKNLTVEFYKNGETYSAKIVNIISPNGETVLDKNNPDRKKRNQPLAGTDLISGLEYSAGSWENGKLYLPKRGMYANCSLSIVNGQLHIAASKGMFSETKIWSREP
jgi:uncharacterized protein (DUF2147 family)